MLACPGRTDMDDPDVNGLVAPTGTVRGEHEIVCRKNTTPPLTCGGSTNNSTRYVLRSSRSRCPHSRQLAEAAGRLEDITASSHYPANPDTVSGVRSFTTADLQILDIWSAGRHVDANKAMATERGGRVCHSDRPPDWSR